MDFNQPITGDDFFLQSFSTDLLKSGDKEVETSEKTIESLLNNTQLNTDEEDDSEDGVDANKSEVDSEEEDEKDSTKGSKEALEDLEEDTIYEKAIKLLADKGSIYKLPEGIDSVENVETFNKVLEFNEAIKEEEIYQRVYSDLDSRLSPFSKQLIDFDLDVENGGGDIINFAKSILYTVDIVELDEEDVKGQIEINKQYYIASGMKPEKVDKIIDSLKENPEKLRAEAIENKPELIELKKKESLKQIEAQKALKDQEDSLRTSFASKLSNQLQTLKVGSLDEGLDEYPLTKEQAQYLYNVMTGTKYPVPIKGKVVEMERLEALAHFHRYADNGNLNRLLTAMLIMEDPKVVFNHFKKMANSKVVVENKNQNNFSNNSGIVFNRKKSAPEKKESIGDKLFRQSL